MFGTGSCIRPCSMLGGRMPMGAPAATVRRAGGACRCLSGGVAPPNVKELCQKARLALTPKEMEDYGPKIERVVEWFAQLQDVNLDDVSPAIRVGGGDGGVTLRPDVPAVFENREAMLAAVPELEGPYLKVPKVLKDNIE